MYTELIAGGATLFSVYVVQNKALREGVTKFLLKWLNKEGINKIPLDQHRVFVLIKTYRNQFATHMFSSEAKNVFYREFIAIVLNELDTFCNVVISKTERGIALDNTIVSELSSTIERINSRVIARLIPPSEKVRIEFESWKNSLLSSLMHSIDETVTDDLVTSTYFKQYRTLDTVRTFLSYLLNSGAKTFSTFNGAFDHIEISKVIKEPSQSG